MPLNTALTGTPKPTLPDPANVETTIAPGFDTLEKFTIPRYSSISNRNIAFNVAPPATGQMCYVSADGARGYYVWNGTAWEELGLYMGVRTLIAVATSDWSTSNSNYQTIDTMNVTLKAGRKYLYNGLLAYRGSATTTDGTVSWLPVNGIQASLWVFAGTGDNSFTPPQVFRDYDNIGVSPDGAGLGKTGVTGASGSMPYFFGGHVIVGSSNTTFQLRAKSSSGTIFFEEGSFIKFHEYF